MIKEVRSAAQTFWYELYEHLPCQSIEAKCVITDTSAIPGVGAIGFHIIASPLSLVARLKLLVVPPEQ